MKRYLEPFIKKDLPSKLVLLTGPRQSGKTTLSKQLEPEFDYFNYDSARDREALKEQSWDRAKKLIVFDELHKMPEWKRWLKGVYDTEGIPPALLVTGSAKLDTYRKVGDSLAGRYFQYRLHPLDLKEVHQQTDESLELIFDRLMQCGGFPEPFLKGTETFYKRWQQSHLEIILRQDLVDLFTVRDLKSIETLVSLLKKRVGSTVSYSTLARDLERDEKTIKRWLQLLENLYVIYRVTPYHRNVARALLKEPKYYFYDHVHAGEGGARLENLVANALLKELDFIQDTLGKKTSLHFVRTRDGREIDFLICVDETPIWLIEVKRNDSDSSPHFTHFEPFFKNIRTAQLVQNLDREKTYPNGLEIRSLLTWLAKMPILSSP